MHIDRIKIKSYLVITVFWGYLAVVLVASLLTKSAEYSDTERKALAQRPFLAECISFNDYARQWESFVSDQFPFRSKIVGSYNDIEIANGSSVVQDVYLLDTDYLFSFVYPLEQWRVDLIAEEIAARQEETGIPFVYVITPQKNVLLAEGVDGLDDSTDRSNLNKLKATFNEHDIEYIDCCSYIADLPLEKKAQYYYKTDIHWNDKGAYTASEYIGRQLALNGYISRSAIPHASDFEWSDYTGRQYLGDLSVRFSIEPTSDEYIPVYQLADSDSCYYYDTIDGSNELMRSDVVGSGLSGEEALKYNTVATDNYSYLRVENPHANTDKSVLIIKDSNQCATIDYFTQMFTELNIVDPRTLTPGCDLQSIIKERDVDLVLCMFHMNNASLELIQYLKDE